ncbi:hypothetical protein HU200_010653 [Digitaria exilis]|uniref:Uncharacterized protein n=1 Tax=Digitaria exilis TaxID=1010633 RepID=A0A835FIR9_9POAL|nr:hypothetical protein HU200_010653 [Digitaria exilis]
MKSIGKKTAEFVRKTMGALRRKAAVLRARLIFLASLRRRMAMVAGISRHIRALTPRQHHGRRDKAAAAAQCRGTAVAAPAEDDEDHLVGLTELARLFADEEGDGGEYPTDWALTLRSLFDDDERCASGVAVVDDGDDDDDEPSVIDVIRMRREGDGREFKIEDEIDEAADMYIKRVRRRIMNAAAAAGASLLSPVTSSSRLVR